MGTIDAPLSDEQKASAMQLLKMYATLAVSTQNWNLAADTSLIVACCGGDTAVAAPLKRSSPPPPPPHG